MKGKSLTMQHFSKLVHLLGLGLFLGSIITFAVASGVPVSGDLAGLSTVRRVISSGTSFVTLPALCALVASGVALLWAQGNARWRGWLSW
jgi:hypothetical protein